MIKSNEQTCTQLCRFSENPDICSGSRRCWRSWQCDRGDAHAMWHWQGKSCFFGRSVWSWIVDSRKWLSRTGTSCSNLQFVKSRSQGRDAAAAAVPACTPCTWSSCWSQHSPMDLQYVASLQVLKGISNLAVSFLHKKENIKIQKRVLKL